MTTGPAIPASLAFEAFSEAAPGEKWRVHFDRFWPAYRKWFLSEGIEARQTYLAGLRALRQYMPELVPTYEQLCELVGGQDLQARYLGFYCPPPYLSGCSQAIWSGDEPLLIRNYDYSTALCEAVVLETCWNGRWVAGLSDGLFGLVDGMNEDGLAVSLTFGGRKIVGDGFGVPLILRYVLEFCRNAKEAAKALERIPCHMSYNVTAIDRFGEHFTAYLSPDGGTVVTDARVATNHQERVEWHRHARATATVERERFLLQRLTLHDEPAERFISAFEKPPLYSTAYDRGFGTLYTSAYWPRRGAFELRWPGKVWGHRVGALEEGVRLIQYPVGAGL
jgi:predicted choloylglycine hydrolase